MLLRNTCVSFTKVMETNIMFQWVLGVILSCFSTLKHVNQLAKEMQIPGWYELFKTLFPINLQTNDY